MALGTAAASCFFVACSSGTAAGPSSRLDAWIPEIRSSFVDRRTWIPDSLAVRRVSDLEVLAWSRIQQVYCISEALIWARLEVSGGDTLYALARGMRWPPDGGDFGDQVPAWALTSSPYAEIEARRFFATPPTNNEIAEVWPPHLFGVGDGFPVIQGEVSTGDWRRLVGEDPAFREHRLDPTASVNCLGN